MNIKKKAKNKQIKIISNLEEIAQSLQIPVEYSIFNGKGGLCRVYGDYRIIINKKLNSLDKILILSSALNFFELDDIFILPEMRDVLNDCKKEKN
jgi:hypothetical protein